MSRLGRTLHVIVGACALFSLAPAYAQPAPAEYRSTTVWWSAQGRIKETGVPAMMFALPVIDTDRVRGGITLNCPQRSDLGPFLEIPKAVWPLGALEGKSVQTFIAVNGEAFMGFVDKDRWLIYLKAAPIVVEPPGMKKGTTVRNALLAGKSRLSFGSGPSPSIVLKATLDDDASPRAEGALKPLITCLLYTSPSPRD